MLNAHTESADEGFFFTACIKAEFLDKGLKRSTQHKVLIAPLP